MYFADCDTPLRGCVVGVPFRNVSTNMCVRGGKMLEPCEDPNYEGNGAKYHTGKKCIELGCNEPAGTGWSPYWCQKHNAERLIGVSKSLKAMIRKLENKNSD